MTTWPYAEPVTSEPPMSLRSVRIPDELWERAKATAVERQENLSYVIRHALEQYVEPEAAEDVRRFEAGRLRGRAEVIQMLLDLVTKVTKE